MIEPLLAELIGNRAELLAGALPAAFARGLANTRGTEGDRASLERALYDEGVALSDAAAQKRRAVIAAARACVRAAIERPEAWPAEIVRVRARTLAHLGGTLGRDALAGALAIRPGTTTHLLEAIEALCRIDPAAAAAAVLARVGDNTGADVRWIQRALHVVELHGGLPVGFAGAWSELHAALGRHGRDPIAWAGALVERGTPSLQTLRWIATCDALPATPHELFARVDELVRSIDRGLPAEAARRAAREPALLDALLLLRPASVDRRLATWSPVRWALALLAAAVVAEPDPRLVLRVARRLGRAPDAGALLVGGLGTLGLAYTAPVLGTDLRIRLLDKRADLLTYLRFADIAVTSCYRSDSRMYRSTRFDVIYVWKDPLSICVRLEHERDGRPRGFVFGGLAEREGRLVLVLNGLYLDRRTLVLRAGVLRAIESLVCRPLGIAEIAVGNSYAGYGPLPAEYGRRGATLTRLRALRMNGAPMTRAYDDVSSIVNGPIAARDLWWSRLA